MYGEELENEEGGVRVSAVAELSVKLQAQNSIVTAIAALLPDVAGAAVEYHTHFLVDLADRLETAGSAINNLVSVVGSMSSSIGDVRILTEDETYLTLFEAVSDAVDALSTTNEVAELDSCLGVLDRVLGELDVEVNEQIKGAIDLLVQRLGITV